MVEENQVEPSWELSLRPSHTRVHVKARLDLGYNPKRLTFFPLVIFFYSLRQLIIWKEFAMTMQEVVGVSATGLYRELLVWSPTLHMHM